MNDQPHSSTITSGFSGPRTGLEYLPGSHVVPNLLNPGITDQMRQAVSDVGYNLDVWTRESILHVMPMGKFSFDCSIGEYCEQLWNMKPVDEEVGQ